MADKANLYEGKDLLKRIVAWRNWNTSKDVQKDLERLVDTYTVLRKDFIIMWENWQRVYSFIKEDNPIANEQTLEAIYNIEEALKKLPDSYENSLLTKEDCHKLMMYFSQISKQASYQYVIYKWFHSKYKDAMRYIYWIIYKEIKDERELKFKELKNSTLSIHKELNEQKEEMLKIEEEKINVILEKRKKELAIDLEDNLITNWEQRKILKDLREEQFEKLKEVKNNFKVLLNTKLDAHEAKESLVKDSLKWIELKRDTELNESYNEFLQKLWIIEQTMNYFENSHSLLTSVQFPLKSIFERIEY